MQEWKEERHLSMAIIALQRRMSVQSKIPTVPPLKRSERERECGQRTQPCVSKRRAQSSEA